MDELLQSAGQGSGDSGPIRVKQSPMVYHYRPESEHRTQLKSNADKNSRTVGHISYNQPAWVIVKVDDWAKVKLDTGLRGWIKWKYLHFNRKEVNETEQQYRKMINGLFEMYAPEKTEKIDKLINHPRFRGDLEKLYNHLLDKFGCSPASEPAKESAIDVDAMEGFEEVATPN